MLVNAARSHLVVVDIQERLLPAVCEGENVVNQSSILLAAAGRLSVPVTVTEQYPKGLGPTVRPIAERVPAHAVILPKSAFSAVNDTAAGERFSALRAEGRDQIVLCGMEAHICVLQTALGLRMSGFEVFVVGNAVSSRTPQSVSAACARLLHAGCQWVTTEMVLFEWLERAGTDEFRALSTLIR